LDLRIYIDGACRGNPGPSSIGVVILDGKGKPIKEHGRFLGEGTNNTAEFTALIEALQLALELGARNLKIHSDSQLLVRQYSGEYKVKNERLAEFLGQIRDLRNRFTAVELVHIPRELNRHADRLANEALDSVGSD